MHELKKEIFVRRPVEEVFAFFQKPENLATMTPPSLGFRILTPSPIRMREGAIIDYTIGVLGMRARWRTMITTFEPPYCFIDEQLKGPYSFWHHTHRFAVKDGGTVITDEVRYLVPFGFPGRIAHVLFIRRQLESIFTYRTGVIKRMFGESAAIETIPSDTKL